MAKLKTDEDKSRIGAHAGIRDSLKALALDNAGRFNTGAVEEKVTVRETKETREEKAPGPDANSWDSGAAVGFTMGFAGVAALAFTAYEIANGALSLADGGLHVLAAEAVVAGLGFGIALFDREMKHAERKREQKQELAGLKEHFNGKKA